MSAASFKAPFKSTIMPVEDQWIDYNGHLNMAFYNVLFDRCVDEAFEKVGLGPDYVKERNCSFYTAEVHVCYVRELAAGDSVYVTLQLLDFDEKRFRFFQELYHADDHWLAATSEQMSLHVDMEKKKVSPLPADIHAGIAAMHETHGALPMPERAGRSIAIPRKAG